MQYVCAPQSQSYDSDPARIESVELNLNTIRKGAENASEIDMQGDLDPISSSNLVFWSPITLVRPASTPVFILVPLSKCRETLLLCDRIDIRADEECNNVEKGDPCVLG